MPLKISDSVLLEISGQTIAWPPNCSEILEIEIAKKIVESELLVQEDQVGISIHTKLTCLYRERDGLYANELA